MRLLRDRKWTAWYHALGVCVALGLAILALISAAPLFIKLFVPMPSLETAKQWTTLLPQNGNFQMAAT